MGSRKVLLGLPSPTLPLLQLLGRCKREISLSLYSRITAQQRSLFFPWLPLHPTGNIALLSPRQNRAKPTYTFHSFLSILLPHATLLPFSAQTAALTPSTCEKPSPPSSHSLHVKTEPSQPTFSLPSSPSFDNATSPPYSLQRKKPSQPTHFAPPSPSHGQQPASSLPYLPHVTFLQPVRASKPISLPAPSRTAFLIPLQAVGPLSLPSLSLLHARKRNPAGSLSLSSSRKEEKPSWLSLSLFSTQGREAKPDPALSRFGEGETKPDPALPPFPSPSRGQQPNITFLPSQLTQFTHSKPNRPSFLSPHSTSLSST